MDFFDFLKSYFKILEFLRGGSSLENPEKWIQRVSFLQDLEARANEIFLRNVEQSPKAALNDNRFDVLPQTHCLFQAFGRFKKVCPAWTR